MVERQITPVGPGDRRCANCAFGHQIVAFMAGGNTEPDGSESRWYLQQPRPIGQTRNCYGWLERVIFEPERFIYPGADDSCINPRKFKPK